MQTRYIDLEDLGVVYGDGSDSTDAIRTAISMIRKATSGYGLNQRYSGITISGPIRTGNIPELSDLGGAGLDGTGNASNGLTIRLLGKWELDETLVLRHVRLTGEPWYSSIQHSRAGSSVLTPSPSMENGSTVLKIVGLGGSVLENIDIVNRRGVGIESWGSNRILKNVNIGLPVGDPKSAGYPALVIGNGYWINFENVNCHRYAKETLPSLPGYPENAVAVIASDPTKPDADYTGLMTWRDSVLSGGSVYIGTPHTGYEYSVRQLQFHNVVTEYGAHKTGEDFATVIGYVEDLTLDRCYPADASVPVSMLNNQGDIYGCRITGALCTVVGNPVSNLVHDSISCAPYFGIRLDGSGLANGMFFGRHEDDGIRGLPSTRVKRWELPTIKLPDSPTTSPAIGNKSGFEVDVNQAIPMGYAGVNLQVGDAIVLKSLVKVGANEHLGGGELIIGFENALIHDGRGGEANYTVSGFRSWPINSGGDLRIGGHWREVIAVAIVKEVGGNPVVNCSLRGISFKTRFLYPCWWHIPASEFDGLEHLKQIISKLKHS